MTIRIGVPSNLRAFANQQSSVEVNAQDVGEALRVLVEQFPELQGKLFSASGQLHSFINLFVNSRSIRDLDGLTTRLSGGETLLIVPALAGG